MSQSRVISFHYTLKDAEGTTIDSSAGDEPLSYMENQGNIIPGLEKELAKLKVGDKKIINVAAADAYGEFRQEMIVDVPHTQFPDVTKIKVGDQFRGQSPDHSEHAAVFTVLEVSADNVKLDGNHPLAGKELFFDVEVTEIRDATEEELAHGHVHGPGGHHHH